MKRKATLLLSMIFVLATIFTGCGGNGEPDSEVKENMSAAEQSTETGQEAGTGESVQSSDTAAQEPVTIRFAWWGSQARNCLLYTSIDVRLFPQYMELKRAEKYQRLQKFPRAGGCGSWELDGSVGSHSAAFYVPFIDNGEKGHCYYKEDFILGKVREAHEKGLQLSSHAIRCV